MPLVGKKLEVSVSIFGKRVREDLLLVDKTLMIKEFFEGTAISLLLRPRRFGKTLMQSQLQHFFAAEVGGVSTQGLFDQFAIAKVDNGAFLKQHQGKYPVIFVSFKDIKESSYQAAVNQINILMQELYGEHKYLLKSDKIDEDDKKKFEKYLDGSVNNEELQHGLKFLSKFLHKAQGKEVIILIDEYDTPLTSAYEHKFLDALSNFMRNMYSEALKDNLHVFRGMLTGILRVSKNSMLSGLNNLEIYTVLDKTYQQYFGFTESEVKELVQYTRTGQNIDEIRKFYNGYKIIDEIIYNPWSLMQFFNKQRLSPYWVLTSNDKLLKDVLVNSDEETKGKLTQLMQGETIEGEVDVVLRYEDLIEKPQALWTLLLFCGYLTVESQTSKGSRFRCQLKIPNSEVLLQYTEIFSDWLKEKLGSKYDSFLRNLVEGNVEKFTQALGDYLMQSLSFRDVGGDKKSERFYHGFVAGLVASLRDTHHLDSNKESGFGLYDFMLTPKSQSHFRSIILEFKHTKINHDQKQEAEVALKQIDALKYDTELKKYPYIKKVLKVGLAFCEKSVISAYREEDLSMHSQSEMTLSQEYYWDPEIYDEEDHSQELNPVSTKALSSGSDQKENILKD